MTIAKNIWTPLLGKWQGEGQGYFPTIEKFIYFETLTFVQRDAMTVHYMQTTEKQYPLQPFETSHWESGFIRMLTDGSLELINAQSGGRGEVLKGSFTQADAELKLTFHSHAQINDPRMVDTTRTFTLQDSTLTYQMEMQTTAVDTLTPHLEAKLIRV